jgi:4-aminobutyrate---pyruvate transaminase
VFAHGFTYSGHPVACAVALKTIEIYQRINIVRHVQTVSPTFQARLKALGSHPLVGEARGIGLIGALELVKNKATKESFDVRQGVGPKVVAFAQEEGLICRAVGGDSIGLCPPLIISQDQINEIFDALSKALDRTAHWVEKELGVTLGS